MAYSTMLSRILVAALASMAVACVPSEQEGEMPAYVQQEDGVFRVDVEQASQGAAAFNAAAYGVVYESADWEGAFVYRPYNMASADRPARLQRFLEHFGVRISPELTPGDGTPSLFIAVREAGESLVYTVFLDGDWQEAEPDGLFLSVTEYGHEFPPFEEGYPLEQVVAVDFSEAIDGLYFQDFEFAQADNPPDYAFTPLLFLSNIEAPVSEIQRRMRVLEWGEDDWVISFSRESDREQRGGQH